MKYSVLAIMFAALIGGAWIGPNGRQNLAQAVEPKKPAADPSELATARSSDEVGHPSFMSPHAAPIALHGSRVFVVNTPADTVDVIDGKTDRIIARVNVGIDPVGIAVRPDGKEVWVANHISDSVSVINTDADSPTHLHVIATVQDFDPKTKATRFDEPVGIAFAGNGKAYVALSSENQIAVVDVPSRRITRRLTIPAQDPRAIAVRGDRLYVIPFESNNKTQLSGGSKIDGDLVTFNAWDHSIRVNNVLSIGHVVDIVKHPKVPDRDLFVFDTRTDELVKVVDTLGTLLYGLAVDSRGRVFIAQADARNEVNGRSGTKKHGLAELENRAFLNQITRVDFKDGAAAAPTFFNLEPLPPKHPAPGQALATPFAVAVSDDDSTLVATAAGSDTVFTVDAETGSVLGRAKVDAVPRGIALESAPGGKPSRAWVLNAVANTVSLVDVSDSAQPKVLKTIALEDPTHPALKRGRIAFESASASSTGTFSCASCHPDGHTDQLLWVLKTPIVTGGDQIMPRSTMPLRGLRDTAPFHWDGIPGDPYGGNNSANVHGSDPPNSKLDDQASTTRHLIDGAMATTMMRVGDETVNDEGKTGLLSAKQRDDLAMFLLGVPYPPAQRRAYDNVVSDRAREGFKLFHIYGDLDPTKTQPNVCGNCHRMPHLVSTNTPGTGMDAPTWRGAYDRFLILPQGRLNIIDFDFYARVADRGIPEREVWRFSWGGRARFDPIWEMVLEGSTGHSGSFARQVTLSQTTARDKATMDLLAALEQADRESAVVLEAEGVLIKGQVATPVRLHYRSTGEAGAYVMMPTDRAASADTVKNDSYTRDELVAMAADGRFVATFTARHGNKDDLDHPQPALWTPGPIERQRGRQRFPILHADNLHMIINGRYVLDGAHIFVDGRRVPGSVNRGEKEALAIQLSQLPPTGMHLLQVQNPGGQFSNDFIFHVVSDVKAARDLQNQLDTAHIDRNAALHEAVQRSDLGAVKRLVERGAKLNEQHRKSGSTPLSTAALHGHTEVAKFLIERGADVSATNRDGNTPLHVAAFLCRTEIVSMLLKKGASPMKKNGRGESVIDVVSGEWNKGLADFYTGIGTAVGQKIDLDAVQKQRPRIARLLREHAGKSKDE